MRAFDRHEDPRARPSLAGLSLVASVTPKQSPLLARLGPLGDVRVTIDFETYRDQTYSLRNKDMTMESYVRDPRFEVLGVGVKFGQRAAVWLEEWEFRAWAERVDWDRVAVVAHHAQFDGLILSHHYGIRPRFIYCTMSMGRVIHGEGGLDELAARYSLGRKGDELDTVEGKRRADLTQAAWRAFGNYCVNDVNLTDGLLDKLLPKMPVEELWLVDTTVRMYTEPIFQTDGVVLQKARRDEIAKKQRVLEKIAEWAGEEAPPPPTKTGRARKPRPPRPKTEVAREVLGSNDKLAALLRKLGVEPPTKKSKTTGEVAFAFAKDDPGMQSLLEHEREEIRDIAEARLAVKSSIIETRTQRIIDASSRGALPFYLRYGGAHTHRWSGGDKLNPQNFNRGGALRDAILAPEGCELVVSDSSQIEARVLAWLARDHELLEVFRRNDEKTRAFKAEVARLEATGLDGEAAEKQANANGFEEGDFYSDVGSTFFLQKISKKATPILRQVAKNMILGLGFGMGWAKFATELLRGMLGSKPVQFTEEEVKAFGIDVDAFERREHGRAKEGEDPVTCGEAVAKILAAGVRLPKTPTAVTYRNLLIHCAVADHFVRLYRTTNSAIAGLWRTMEKALEVMATPGGDPNEVRMTFGPLKFIYQGIIKPNGLILRYPGLRRGSDGWKYQDAHGAWTKVYGGLLTENAVQSLARDVVAEQMLYVRAKYQNSVPGHRSPIGTCTHDEVVAVVRAEQAAECLAFTIRRMSIPPPWAEGLPLAAEGGHGRCYGSIK